MSFVPTANAFITSITSNEPAIRNRSLRELSEGLSTPELLRVCGELDEFRREAPSLYERVRAAMFLHALYRYRIQDADDLPETGPISFEGVQCQMARRFEQAVSAFSVDMRSNPNGATASALAHAYSEIAFQILADQVRRSVRSCSGNRWMFRVGSVDEISLKIHPSLVQRVSEDEVFPILVEQTPVRLDLSHSAWSDIFFLGMDYPEAARVLNISTDLGVHGRDDHPRPPIETFCRVIAEPILRLTSIDLNACKDIHTLDELFNFGNDYLGLVKAGVIASGLIPPSFEGTATSLPSILARLVQPGYGIEVVSRVNDIPKGSRLAVSTNLLASIISLLMRATGQARHLTGPLSSYEARVVVSRAILGEWLGGSGGGWQDSGGVFPGLKIIRGVAATEADPEWGVSRGRLLPDHEILRWDPTSSDATHVQASCAEALAKSLVLIHGGMAQNVGPILNMVTQKYLLRSREEWDARDRALAIFEQIAEAVRAADVRKIGSLTTANWEGPLKQIIPWVSNAFTETLISEVKSLLGEDYWGFLMLGGMSGGGMGFFVAPARQESFRDELGPLMRRVKSELDDALPFAMEPVVYDFRINPHGTMASLREGREAVMPSRYYSLQVGAMIAQGVHEVESHRKADIDHFANGSAETGELLRVFRTMINGLFPVARSAADAAIAIRADQAETIRRENGFDSVQHASLREDIQRGRIGLARNRLPVATEIRDVQDQDLIRCDPADSARMVEHGSEAIRRGEFAIVTLAAGVGSRWTTGAGVVKAVNPFVAMEGTHRSFLEIHLAKTSRTQATFGVTIPHVVTTSYLTHSAIDRHLTTTSQYGHKGPVRLSRGQSIGQRLIPMARDLTFLWDEQTHEQLDENKQKVRDASRRAILEWARSRGEGSDYTDNVPIQRFNPPGHFYEVPTLLRNGILVDLLNRFPNLQWLMAHNIDTLGANLDPLIAGLVLESGNTLNYEVIPRRIDDRGGGLARVGGRLRLLEGLAQPRDDIEFRLRYYNSMTTWVHIDRFLESLGISRDDLQTRPNRVAEAIREMASRLPTYVTIKDVKRRWGQGQEDVFPVAQFEKLWGDLTSLADLSCGFLAVSRQRGQQLKDTAQLDGWVNDGSRGAIEEICAFSR